jgi:hypothetical protein
MLGAAGGVAGAIAGYQVRMRIVKALKVPALLSALLEDAVAIAGAFLLCRGSKRGLRRKRLSLNFRCRGFFCMLCLVGVV